MSPPSRSVRHIGTGVSYRDGSEAELIQILARAHDRSSGSDELAGAIVDWPTRYHLSPQRSNLLRPLRVAPGARVLDIGAGTGVAARYLGEQGADVVALEGSADRAEAAAARCADLPNVEVVCGAPADLQDADGFDVVMLIGVLEYTGAEVGGSGGASSMLAHARRLLRPSGALVLAIENQLGLKYLLGAPEDHHGRPWVGIDDYPGPPAVRTWSRAVLRGMLDDAGFGSQRWLYPFPDYKLPSLVLHEQLYSDPEADELIDQLVQNPVVIFDGEPARGADGGATQRALVRAGLGEDTANSFLVLAGEDPDGLERLVDGDALAWMFGPARRSTWRRHRMLRRDRTLVTLGDNQTRSCEWLTQEPGGPRPYQAGRTLGQIALDAVRAHDRPGLGDVLRRWHDELDRRAIDLDTSDPPAPARPFQASRAGRALPDGHLDVSLSNFVDGADGLVLIDDEWRVGCPVDFTLVTHRALWVLAREIVTSGIDHSWGDEATLSDVLIDLTALAGLPMDDRISRAFEESETQLQLLVAAESEETIRLRWLDGSLRGIDLRRDRRDARDAALAREALEQLSTLRQQRDEFLGQRDHLVGVVAAREAEVDRLRSVRGFVRAQLRAGIDRYRAKRSAPRGASPPT